MNTVDIPKEKKIPKQGGKMTSGKSRRANAGFSYGGTGKEAVPSIATH
jgi:hypothetical protein